MNGPLTNCVNTQFGYLLILLLVFLGRQTLQHVRNAGVEPEAPAAATTAFADTSPEAIPLCSFRRSKREAISLLRSNTAAAPFRYI